ncbi:MAG TPA: hypothetical protein DCY13_02295 [Verrucomicrobiales bacterium]|nr:hypothetical protein [Verrucomicrobiales bacterium]
MATIRSWVCRCPAALPLEWPVPVHEIVSVNARPLIAGPAMLSVLCLAMLTVLSATGADHSSGILEGQSAFYDPDKVQTIRLEISREDLARMKSALPELIYVPGVLRWNDVVVTNVGIRYKGGSSSRPESPHKRSFLVKFSEFEKGQRFLGLRRLSLDNGIQFGSLFSERLITDILREVGVRASRCNYARVLLNGEFMGVYVNVERIDESFLERSFGSRRGPLFKVHDGGPGADLRPVPGGPQVYAQTFDLQTDETAEAFPLLAEFIRRLNDPAAPGARELHEYFDVDGFLKATAVLLFSGAFDQYTGWGPHNYYLHHHAAAGRWTYVPWDLDVGFADRAFGRVPVLDGWHAAWPAPVPDRPLLERIIADPELLARYRREADLILEKFFRPEVLIPKLHRLHEQVKADLERDPFPPRRATVPSDAGYADVISSMEDFIRRRYELARAQLDQPGPRPNPAQSPGGGPPAPASDSSEAPAGLHLVRATADGVELRWTDRAEGERFFIVQRASASADAPFQNVLGLPGENLTGATDPHVMPGMTYRYRVYAVKPTPQGPKGTGVSNVITVRVPEG